MGRPTRTPTVKAATFTLFHGYEPRGYQRRVLGELMQGRRYAVLVWHRRAGKDTTAFNWLLLASQQRVGTYYYLFPTFTWGKRVLWQGMTREGRRLLEYIPPAMIQETNETDMRIVFRNGSALQVVGTDNFDSVRGTNPVGLVFSEYAQQNPAAWEVFSPILEENGGWAVFVYTPAGRNHGYDLYEMARNNPEWFAERLTIEDTDVYDAATFIPRMRAQGRDESYLQQEYYCAFTGSVQGAFYAQELQQARADGRITRVPYDPQVPVETAWDIGTTKDANAIWFYQQVGRRVQLIDYHEVNNTNLVDLSRLILHEKRYAYLPGTPHIAPHDLMRTEYSSGRTIRDLARDVGLEFRLVPKQNHWERIVAARMLFSRCYFDEAKCHQGLRALAHYHREWDEETKHFSQKEHKDWSNHGADAFGHLAVGIEPPVTQPRPEYAVTSFSVLDPPPLWRPGPERVEAFDPFRDPAGVR